MGENKDDASVDYDFFNQQKALVANAACEINKKKEEAIRARLIELGIEEEFENEENRRFKRFAVEISSQEETYWYNDGSEEGLRIITFHRVLRNASNYEGKKFMTYSIRNY